MIYLLCIARNKLGAYWEGDTPIVIEPRGSIVDVRAQEAGYGTKETIPNFVRIVVNATVSQAEQYLGRWVRNVDFDVESNNQVLDTIKLRFYSDNAGTSLDGAIQLEQLEKYFALWGFTVDSTGENEVFADISIYDALTSEGLWGNITASVDFTEVSYTQATGNHRISADYSRMKKTNIIGIDRYVRAMGGINLSHDHDNQVIEYDMTRSDVTGKMQASLSKMVDTFVRKYRYSVSDTLIDAAVTAGGEIQVTPAQMVNNLEDLSE